MSVQAPPERLAIEKRQLLRSFEAALDYYRELDEAGDTLFSAPTDHILFESADLRVLADYAATMNASLSVFVAALLDVVSENNWVARDAGPETAKQNQADETGELSDGDAIDIALQRLKRITDTAEEALAERKKALRQMARNERKINSAQNKNAELIRRLVRDAKK